MNGTAWDRPLRPRTSVASGLMPNHRDCLRRIVRPYLNWNKSAINPKRLRHLLSTYLEDDRSLTVVTIQAFETEEEVLRYANSVRYGLSATVWTENLSVAHRVAQKIEAGIIWINCWLLRDLRTPFGGVKDSGVGREGGFEALRFFTEEKNVCVKVSQ